ncbi:MAG: hypothetical protein K1X89_12020 [Myxococcaceae bacterium]|nr:hypothetical protein [Myxococcaceae bacterium]
MVVKALNTAVRIHGGFKPLETRRDQKALEQAQALTAKAVAPAPVRTTYDASSRAQDLVKAEALLSGAAKGGVTVRQQSLYGEVVTALDGAHASIEQRRAAFQAELDATLDGRPDLAGAFLGEHLVTKDPDRPGHYRPTPVLDALAFGPTVVPYRVIDFDYPEHEDCEVFADTLPDVAKALDRDLLQPWRERRERRAAFLDGLKLQRLGLETRGVSSGAAVDQALTRLGGAGFRAHPERDGGNLEVSVALLKGEPVNFIRTDGAGRWLGSTTIQGAEDLLQRIARGTL